ncbi:hypothetical protein LCGC14_2987880, partial [marine sediment metagenome]
TRDYRRYRHHALWRRHLGGPRGRPGPGGAAPQSGRALRGNILAVAGAMLQAEPDKLDIRDGKVVDSDTGAERMDLADMARTVYYRGNELPDGVSPEFVVTRHYTPRQYPFCFTNGIQACWLEVDAETGFVELLKYWVVEDCGVVINPQLVDDQIRGGVVQGIGQALCEHVVHDPDGQLLTATFMDYAMPRASDLPFYDVDHSCQTPCTHNPLGVKGCGEAGAIGSPPAVVNAVLDAMRSGGKDIGHIDMPVSPARVWEAMNG